MGLRSEIGALRVFLGNVRCTLQVSRMHDFANSSIHSSELGGCNAHDTHTKRNFCPAVDCGPCCSACNRPPIDRRTAHVFAILSFRGSGAEGTTTLAFHIAVDGTTKDVSVAKSSGNPDLDAAAVQCVSGWHYVPASHDSKPVEADWKANVEWKLRTLTNETPPGALQTHACHNFPHQAVWDGAKGVAIVTFHIGADGVVKDPKIVETTGDDDLDRATIVCVSRWQYKPATRDGVAIEIPWRAAVDWYTHEHPLSPCIRYANVTPELLAGISGVSKVSFKIQQDGAVSDTSLLASSGNGTLDHAALLCINEMRFDVSRAKLPTSGIVKSVSVNWSADLPHDTKKIAEKQPQDPLAAKLPGGTDASVARAILDVWKALRISVGRGRTDGGIIQSRRSTAP